MKGYKNKNYVIKKIFFTFCQNHFSVRNQEEWKSDFKKHFQVLLHMAVSVCLSACLSPPSTPPLPACLFPEQIWEIIITIALHIVWIMCKNQFWKANLPNFPEGRKKNLSLTHYVLLTCLKIFETFVRENISTLIEIWYNQTQEPQRYTLMMG